jgi:pyrroloquinoline quinone (PQQ) biosynthesis protein C
MDVAALRSSHGVRRVYEATPREDGSVALRLRDRVIELGPEEAAAYRQIVEWLPASRDGHAPAPGMDGPRLARLCDRFCEAGLFYRRADIPASTTGEQFYRDHFAPALDAWLAEAFSHPFWERMSSGRGSARLFTGWLIELYHYTRNANRHMPLSCAYTRDKPIKSLRARHYAEEWNHYHYFLKSLRHLGLSEGAVVGSMPLPMTLALSNFMRQAAREDILAYSICSAVLEGTTQNRGSFDAYYQRVVELYGIPRAAVKPIYDHLDLDVQYEHGNLFLEILGQVDDLPAARAARVLDYGHLLVEHIWMWTESIERYYAVPENPVPRRPFDPFAD